MSGTDVAGLRRAVLGLTLTQRRVLILHFAEGLTPHEVASVLGLGEARVCAILAELRAMAQRHIAGAATERPIGTPGSPPATVAGARASASA